MASRSKKPSLKERAQQAAAAAPQRPVPVNPPTAPSKELHVFANPAPERDYVIQFEIPEFTCNCPLTGQPDFAHFKIEMIADDLCIELKSLKMYLWSYRNEGAFHEKVTNAILDDIVKAASPRFARIAAAWNVRGGIYTNVVAEHRKKGWKPQPAIELASQRHRADMSVLAGHPPYQKFAVRVARSRIDGFGVFASEPIPPRRKIGEIRGESISVAEGRRRAAGRERIMIVEISARRAIDASASTDPMRFTNHSCAPNARLLIRDGRIEFYSLRAIAAAEELTVNYGETHHEGRLACRCGAAGCVGRL